MGVPTKPLDQSRAPLSIGSVGSRIAAIAARNRRVPLPPLRYQRSTNPINHLTRHQILPSNTDSTAFHELTVPAPGYAKQPFGPARSAAIPRSDVASNLSAPRTTLTRSRQTRSLSSPTTSHSPSSRAFNHPIPETLPLTPDHTKPTDKTPR